MSNRTMSAIRAVSVLACLLFWQGTAMAARKVELALPWSQLAPVIDQRRIALVLPGGTHVEGKVIDVTGEALVLNVTKTSDSSAQPKGKTSIARSAVSVIRLNETKGSKRWLWTSVGGGAGAASGWLLAEGVYHVSGEGQGIWKEPAGAGLIMGLAGGGAALGYILGRSSDQVETYIKIVSEENPKATMVIPPGVNPPVVLSTRPQSE